MIGRVVEISSEGCHLARDRGLLTVSKDDAEIGRVPLDDIGALICDARGLTYSNGLMVELARRNVPVVLCEQNHMPVAWLWPLEGHHIQALRMRAQFEAPLPMRKRLWQSVVRAKIEQQANTLRQLQIPSDALESLARRVRSGDPQNVEAQAARIYWPLLFGPSFRRGRYGGGPNSLLNYGYTVLRAAVARAIVSAGLHPSVGIHHSNRGNAFLLVDDLMEPFRPLIDYRAVRLVAGGGHPFSRDDDGIDQQSDVIESTDEEHVRNHRVGAIHESPAPIDQVPFDGRDTEDEVEDSTGTPAIPLTPEIKQSLAAVLAMDMITERGTTPLQTCIERAALSLATSFESGRPRLLIPSGPATSF